MTSSRMAGLVEMVVAGVVGAMSGAGAAVVAFRTQLLLTASTQKLVNEYAARERERDRAEVEARFLAFEKRVDSYERRQLVILDLLVSIAGKLGINHRITDLMQREGTDG